MFLNRPPVPITGDVSSVDEHGSLLPQMYVYVSS